MGVQPAHQPLGIALCCVAKNGFAAEKAMLKRSLFFLRLSSV
jgi:hypothetical protein